MFNKVRKISKAIMGESKDFEPIHNGSWWWNAGN